LPESFYEDAIAKLRKRVPQRKAARSLSTGDFPGPMILSRDRNESAVEPVFIELKDIDEAKDLGGFPNSEFESGKLDIDLLPIPQAFSREVTPNPQPFSQPICQAMQAYIYGDSKFVKSYRDVLNQLRFPLTLTVHEGEDIVVKKDHPLIIKDNGHGEPFAVVYRKITVEPGGQIIWQGATGSLIAKEMIYQQPTAGVDLAGLLKTAAADGQNFVSVGAPGGDGSDGTTPNDPGTDGTDAVVGKDNKNSCARQPVDGTEGKPGPDGSDAEDGEAGGDGNEVNVTIDNISGIIYVGSGGGKGGKGGKGGDGKNGGRGGNGVDKTSHCDGKSGKKGGKGGKAGKGGKGGDGGDGKNVYFTYKAGSPNFILTQATGTGGTGGSAGSPGSGGKGGTHGGDAGDNGDKADGGKTGATGLPGQVFINGKALS